MIIIYDNDYYVWLWLYLPLFLSPWLTLLTPYYYYYCYSCLRLPLWRCKDLLYQSRLKWWSIFTMLTTALTSLIHTLEGVIHLTRPHLSISSWWFLFVFGFSVEYWLNYDLLWIFDDRQNIIISKFGFGVARSTSFRENKITRDCSPNPVNCHADENWFIVYNHACSTIFIINHGKK